VICLLLPGADDVAELIDSLHDGADACEPHAPALAAKRRALANAIGDELDRLPRPTIREDHDTP
jgi:hypothetical protein